MNLLTTNDEPALVCLCPTCGNTIAIDLRPDECSEKQYRNSGYTILRVTRKETVDASNRLERCDHPALISSLRKQLDAANEEIKALRYWFASYVQCIGWHTPPDDSTMGQESAAILAGQSAIPFADRIRAFRKQLGLDTPPPHEDPPPHPDEQRMRDLRVEFAEPRRPRTHFYDDTIEETDESTQ